MSCAPGAAGPADCQTMEVPGFVSREACVASARATVRSMVHALAVSGTDTTTNPMKVNYACRRGPETREA